MSGEWLGTADVPLPDPHARMPGFPYEPHPPCVEGDQEPSSDTAAAPARIVSEAMTNKDFERYRSRKDANRKSAPVPAGEELLHYGHNVVTLPAAEAALLTRIAEVAGELRNPEPETKMTLVRLDRLYELTKLTNEWRIEWKHK